MRKVFSGLVPLAAVIVAVWLITLDRQGQLLWDHWDEVKRGILYRSGQLTREQLTEAVKRYQIRTVINLQWPGEEMKEERALSRQLGVDFVNLPMPGDGLGEEKQFREVLKILDEADRRPALVHCARDLPDRGDGCVLSIRARWLDSRGCRERAGAPDLSLWPGTGLYLRDGQDQAPIVPAPGRVGIRPQPRAGSASRRGRSRADPDPARRRRGAVESARS